MLPSYQSHLKIILLKVKEMAPWSGGYVHYFHQSDSGSLPRSKIIYLIKLNVFPLCHVDHVVNDL